MAVRAIGHIAPQDYDAFRGVAHDNFPDTYDEWLYLQLKQESNFGSAGIATVKVEIKAAEFAAHCRAANVPASIEEFWRFTAEKAATQADKATPSVAADAGGHAQVRPDLRKDPEPGLEILPD